MSFTNPAVPTEPRNETTLSEFADYAQAQELVDRLSDKGFDVKNLRIVGSELRIVEQVTGRMTTGRSALLGAASGAWFGLLLGLILGLFAPGTVWLNVMLGGLLLGAGWGLAFGAVRHWATRGKRDFASVRTMEAGSYAVMVASDSYNEAARLGNLI